MNYKVDLNRLQKDLIELSRIGYNEEDCGIYRMAFTEADVHARRWLVKKIQKLGLESYIDGAGNVIGRFEKPDKPVVAVGSHIDTVPCGGMFDGALGFIAALECIRVISENNIKTKYPIEIIGFSDEEGRFGGMFGVEAMIGKISSNSLETAEDAEGIKLKDVMLSQGFDPIEALNAYREPESFHAFLEMHIEQGPVLEKIGKPIGVVEGIAGVFKWVVRLIGKADHEGTAPMDMRSDTFMGLADFAHEIPRIIDEEGTDKSRLTVGKAELKPGSPHTVPGEVDFTLVGRDMKPEVMRQIADTCRKVLSAIARRHKLMFEYKEMSWLEPTNCHPDIIEVISNQAEQLGYDYHLMVSGAGHDTQFMTEVSRSGMIFVPSVGGISHAPDEWTKWRDIEKGANLLLNSILKLAEVLNDEPYKPLD